MASCNKKPRCSEEDEIDSFPERKENQELKNALKFISSQRAALETLTILECNQTSKQSRLGKSFSEADIVLNGNESDLYSMSVIFQKGIDCLQTYLDNPSAPCDHKYAIRSLFIYLQFKGNEKIWHGKLNILLDNVAIFVVQEDAPNSSGGLSVAEEKLEENLENIH